MCFVLLYYCLISQLPHGSANLAVLCSQLHLVVSYHFCTNHMFTLFYHIDNTETPVFTANNCVDHTLHESDKNCLTYGDGQSLRKTITIKVI